MVSFAAYTAISFATAAWVIYQSFSLHPQFYDAAQSLCTSKAQLMVLGNLGFACMLLLGRLFKTVFLGKLSADEVDEVVHRGKIAVTETGLALAIFREDLNAPTLALFAALLFMKVFHLLAHMRVDSAARMAETSWGQSVRLKALILVLFLCDCLCTLQLGRLVWEQRRPSVLLLFTFEWCILLLLIGTVAMKHLILTVDSRQQGDQWTGRATLLFYVEFISELLHLTVLVIFFGTVCMYYSLPLHLVPEIWGTFISLRERARRFVYFRTIARNLERFPSASAEDLVLGQGLCSVCLEEMQPNGEAKRLPCAHCFHTTCLLGLLEQSNRCPTCRAEIPAAVPDPEVPDVAAPAPAAVPAAAPAAPQAAPAAPAAGQHPALVVPPEAVRPFEDSPSVFGVPAPAGFRPPTAATDSLGPSPGGTASSGPRPPLFFQPVLDMGPGSLALAQQHLEAHQQYRDWLRLQLRHAEEVLELQRGLVDRLAHKYDQEVECKEQQQMDEESSAAAIASADPPQCPAPLP